MSISIRLFLGNIHIILFLCTFFVGFLFLVLSPLKFINRTGRIPTDLGLYNELEKKLLIWGMVLGLVGVLGAGIMAERFGYKYTFKEIDGTVRIVDSKNRKY